MSTTSSSSTAVLVVGPWARCRARRRRSDAALADQRAAPLGLGGADAGLVEGAADLAEGERALLGCGVEKVLDGRGQARPCVGTARAMVAVLMNVQAPQGPRTDGGHGVAA